MRPSRSSLLIWLIVALLLFLGWLTVSGRLGESRHGYVAARQALNGAPALQPRAQWGAAVRRLARKAACPLLISCGASRQSFMTAFGFA